MPLLGAIITMSTLRFLFQISLRHWYHLLKFLTGKNRTAHPLVGMKAVDFKHPSAVRFIAPYCWTEGAS